MILPEQHFKETEKLLKLIDPNKIGSWLLEEGYFPEQYVVPPTFIVKSNPLNIKPFYEVDTTAPIQKFEPEKEDLVTVSFPKTQLTDRTFGIIAPKIYHDVVWYLINEWQSVINHLFHKDLKIYSYSFPLPVSSQNIGSFGSLRAGRMIYEFLEMAENDLVAEGFNYKYIMQTDIKNFYPSVYTHSIAWALHTKSVIRAKGNKNNFSKYLGLKLDKLFQYANDGCTNGIAIGPAISDLISEIVLTAVDRECSKEIIAKGIDFIGVRFKDDYRFLCNSKEDAHFIIKSLQSQMREFNLTLNESKSDVKELPEGLFREWTSEYQQFSLRYKKKISYKRFEKSLLGTLKVDKKFEGTGVIDRFLSELSTKKYNLKLDFNEKDVLKAISLLLLLKERRNKALPQILAIIEKIIEVYKSNKVIVDKIKLSFEKILNEKFKNELENQYDLIWLIYFIKANDLFKISYPTKIKSVLIKSLKNNSLEFFKPLPIGCKLFQTIKGAGKNTILLEHLAIFKKGTI
jgi:hypothetical protein